MVKLPINCCQLSIVFYFRQSHDYADIEDNDFAEFDFEDETDESLKVTDDEEDDFDPMETEDDEAEVEVESEGEDEFSHFEDDEEFEGFKPEDVDKCLDEYETLDVWQINQAKTKITIVN